MKKLCLGALLLFALLLSGCFSSNIVKLSPDTYMLRIEDHGGIFAFNRGKLKPTAIQEANEFAASKGKIAIPVAMDSHPVGILGDYQTQLSGMKAALDVLNTLSGTILAAYKTYQDALKPPSGKTAPSSDGKQQSTGTDSISTKTDTKQTGTAQPIKPSGPADQSLNNRSNQAQSNENIGCC